MTCINFPRRLCPSQTTFKQATKNLHQTLCLSKITLLLGLGFSTPCEKHVRTASLDWNVEKTSLTKDNPHSSSVPTPNTLRCLPRNYGYFYTSVSQNPQELPDFTYLFVPNYPYIRQEKSEKNTGMSKKHRIPLLGIRYMTPTCYQQLKKMGKGRGYPLPQKVL